MVTAAATATVAIVVTLTGPASTVGVAAAATPRSATPRAADPNVVVGAGGRAFIADDQGRALILHGQNIGDKGPGSGDSGPADVTQAKLHQMALDGFNAFRLLVVWANAEPVQGQWSQAYFDRVGQILDWANQEHLAVVLDMNNGFAPPPASMPAWVTRTDGIAYTNGSQNNLDPAVQRSWQHFYEDADIRQAQVDELLQFVNRFHTKPALLGYDLLNEPDGEIKPGESLVAGGLRVEATQLTPMAQRLIDGVRTVDQAHWILVEPLWGLESSLTVPTALGTLHDPAGRLAYAPHIYNLSMELGADYDPASGFVDKWASAITTYPNAHQMPLLVWEWGPRSPALPHATDYVAQVMRAVDHVAAGWAGFYWCQGLAGWCELGPDGNPGAGMAQTLRPYPTAVAGAPTDIWTDPTAHSVDLTFTDTAATAHAATDFFLPTGQYPGTPFVHVNAAAGTWTTQWDPSTRRLSVTVTADGTDHEICVSPTAAGCPRSTPPVTATTVAPATTPPTTAPVSPAAPASPVSATPTFTG